MKKVIFLLGLVLCLCSCTPLVRREYQCTITYNLDGVSHVETDNLIFDKRCMPTYVLSEGMLEINGVPSQIFHENKLIYKGSLPVTVEKFEYKLVKEFNASRWNGREK